MSDEDLRKIFTDALEDEHMCEVMGYYSRTEGTECPCCHIKLFKADYLGDFVCSALNKKYYKNDAVDTNSTPVDNLASLVND
jgi:hypothetical protein